MDLRDTKCYFHALRLMGPHSAIDLEMRTGMKQFTHLMSKEVTFFPDASTWKAAVNFSTPFERFPSAKPVRYKPKIGLLLYCVQRKIPCTEFQILIQYCVDHAHIRELLILGMRPVNEHGHKLKFQDCKVPELDRALKHGHFEMVAIARQLFGQIHIDQVDQVLERLFLHWEWGTPTLLQILVKLVISPGNRDFAIRSLRTLRIAAFNDEAIAFALRHCSPKAIGEELMIDLVKRGNLNSIQYIIKMFPSQKFTQLMWNEAFFNGHRHITDHFPQYQINDEVLIQACRYGCLKVIQSLPSRTHFPSQCFLQSIVSGNVELICYMRSKFPDLPISRNMLMSAIKSTDESKHQDKNPFLTVFRMGCDAKLLDRELKCALVDHDLIRTILKLHKLDMAKKLGLKMFNRYTLARAAQRGNIELLKSMMTHPFSQEAIEYAQEASMHPIQSFDQFISRTAMDAQRFHMEHQQVQDLLTNFQLLIKDTPTQIKTERKSGSSVNEAASNQ